MNVKNIITGLALSMLMGSGVAVAIANGVEYDIWIA
tara:strand:+ start:423 stop:530 length:108 start_codon:yes stop_codon:yes gene_type:complete